MNYTKIVKYISWALLIIGVLAEVIGFAVGFEKNDAAFVDVLLYLGYAMIAIAILGIIVFGILTSAQNNPKGLIKTAIIAVAVIAVIVIAYAIAPGSDPVGYHGADVAHSTLKLTDTILILTYAFFGVAILAVVAGAIVGSMRNK